MFSFFRQLKIRARLILIFSLMVLFPLIVTMLISTRMIFDKVEQGIEEQTDRSLSDAENFIANYLEQSNNIANLLTELDEVKNILNKKKNLQELLDSKIDYWFMALIEVADQQGDIIARSHAVIEGIDQYYSPDRSALINDALEFKKQTLLESHNNCLIIRSISPIIDRISLNVLGAVIVSYPLSNEFADLIKDASKSEVVFFTNNEIVSTSFFDQNGQRFYDIPLNVLQLHQIFKLNENYYQFLTIQGRSYRVAAAPLLDIIGQPIGALAIGVQNETIKKAKTASLYILILSVLLVSILTFIMGYFIAREFTQSLTQLIDGARRVGEGNLNSRIQIQRYDEFGLLAQSFNEMAKNLEIKNQEIALKNHEIENYNKELEVKVHERTIDLQQVNKKLHDSIEKVKEADRMKSVFLTNMSHELRTPLNSIIGFSGLMMQNTDQDLSDRHLQDLTTIYNNGKHLLNLINDILDLSKIEAGKMEIEIKPFNLTNLINSAMSTCRVLIKGKNIELKMSLSQKAVWACADEFRTRQVLLNILSNAAKFTDSGTISSGVVLTQNDEYLKIWVKDTGCGIKEEDYSKVFEEFRQTESALAKNKGGTGLGMAISKRFVEMMGGQIWLESQPEIGTTFYFTLPSERNEATEKTINPNKKVVLIIEDEPAFVKIYKEYLSDKNYEIYSLSEKNFSITKISEIKPSAVILDFLHFQSHGLELLKQIKSASQTKDIPVIACSIIEDKHMAFNLGAEAYIVKPISRNDLLSVLSKIHIPKGHIVIIDDNINDVILMSRILEQANYMTLKAYNGKSGIEMIREFEPQAIILDIMMPGMDGFEVVTQLKKDKKTEYIPVIVLTAKELSLSEKNQLSQYAVEIVSKNGLNKEEFLEQITHLIG